MTDDLRILVTGAAGVSLVEGTPGSVSSTLIAPGGRWPAWNPLYDVAAVSVVEGETSQLRLIDLAGRTERVFYQPQSGVPQVIAPRVPHYAMWSPGGDVLSYVAQSTYGLTLFLSHIDGSFGPDAVINGAPLFSSWCTDNNFLAVHSGEELACVEVQGSRTTAEVSPQATGFRTPAYSDDAEVLAYAIARGGGEFALMTALFQGTGSREISRFGGAMALQFRPGTQDLSVAVTNDASTGGFDELWMVDLLTTPANRRSIYRGQFVSSLWSPTGDRVALVVPTYGGDGRYAFRVLDANGAGVAASEPFLPSEDYRIYLGFFDQYANSHHLWDGDGTTLIVGGQAGGDSVSPSFGDPAGPYVMTWKPEKGERFQVLCPGEIGFFAPRPKVIR